MKKRSFYLFSLLAFKEKVNELYMEYHLGRLDFRLCKQVQFWAGWPSVYGKQVQSNALVPLQLRDIQ
jgi:hypothetical protein